MEDILLELGLEHLLPRFEANMVGPHEVLALNEEEFNLLGISTIGEKARLRQKCRNKINVSHLFTSNNTCFTLLHFHFSHETLHTILTRLSSIIDTNGKKNIINVDRDDVLSGAKRGFLRSSFNEKRLLSVRFSGEPGIDDGGPSREFVRLATRAIRDSSLFEGGINARILCPDIQSEERGDYKLYGKMLAYFIVIKGTPPAFFSELMFQAVAYGLESCTPNIEDINDYELREQVQKISEADDIDGFNKATEPLSSIIDFIGALPITTKLENKSHLVNVLCKHIVIRRVQQIFSQFVEGLHLLGVYREIQKYPEIMKGLFINQNVELTAVMVDDLFEVQFSQEGSNNYRNELKTQSHWRDFLQDLEEEAEGLEKLLIFVTGYDRVPPLGFEPSLCLHFTHPENEYDGVPYANTCANKLSIPVLSSYESFKERMVLAIEFSPMFTNN